LIPHSNPEELMAWHPLRVRRKLDRWAFFVAFGIPILACADARAQEASATPTVAPAASKIGLGDAVKLARTRGYDVVLASAAVRGAEGDVRAAGQLPNPLLQPSVGFTLQCPNNSCQTGNPGGYGIGLADQGLVEGALTRKRALKEEVAQRALDAAKFGRVDAERIIVAATKIQYIQTAAAAAKLDFTKDVAASLAKSVEVTRARYPGVIDEGQLARVEQEGLKADQEVDRAQRDYRQQQIELAFLLGHTGAIPDLQVDKEVLKFRVPDALSSANKDSLFRVAIENRPDRRQALAKEAQGDAQIAYAKRVRFPDVSLSANYAQQGTGDYTSQLPTLTFGASFPIPLFYQQQGEIYRAEADREAASTARRKIEGTLFADIESAFSAFTTARSIVERYESALLERAKRAREITQVQFDRGAARLTDLLDAQRSFVAVNSDYYVELVNYWTAVFQLEQAIGKELTP
jgi:cobalt-zinc-cadmium efflux system outer membrane protein